jgi:hypothetical protein
VILGWKSTANAQVGSLAIEAILEIEQDESASSGEKYLARYVHEATVTLGGLTLSSKIHESAWKGWEVCFEPPLDIEWESEISFDAFDYEEPEAGVLVRNGYLWILYHPAREFGVKHPGRPPCDSGDGIASQTMVAKAYYHGDLEEGAEPIGGFPVAVYDESEAFGGFVVAVVPLGELRPGASREHDAEYRFTDHEFSIGLAIRMKVTPLDR